MLHHWRLPGGEAIGHGNTHVARHTKHQSVALFTISYLRVESIHVEGYMTIWNVHARAVRALRGGAASFLFPRQTMLMLKRPDGLASSAQGHKRCDTDSIRLGEKMGGGGSQEMHYPIKVRRSASRARRARVVGVLDPCQNQ